MKTRRERGDFIQIYKIVYGLEKVNWRDENKILRPEKNNTDRKHPFQLSRERKHQVTSRENTSFST